MEHEGGGEALPWNAGPAIQLREGGGEDGPHQQGGQGEGVGWGDTFSNYENVGFSNFSKIAL